MVLFSKFISLLFLYINVFSVNIPLFLNILNPLVLKFGYFIIQKILIHLVTFPSDMYRPGNLNVLHHQCHTGKKPLEQGVFWIQTQRLPTHLSLYLFLVTQITCSVPCGDSLSELLAHVPTVIRWLLVSLILLTYSFIGCWAHVSSTNHLFSSHCNPCISTIPTCKPL